LARVRRGRVSVYGLDSEVAGSPMDRVKDYDTKQRRTAARPVVHAPHRSHAGHVAGEAGPEGRRVLPLGCGNRGIAIDLNPSHVALA